MSEPAIGKNCPLSRYLKEVSISDKCDLKAQLAGVLFYSLDFDRLALKTHDLASTKKIIESIAISGQTDLLFETRNTCLNCPQLTNCKVGALMIGS
jgi:hypothetical protein